MIRRKILFAGVGMFLFITVTAHAQAELGVTQHRNMRSEQMALRQSLLNTIFPVVLGTGSVALFEDHTVRTIGAWMTVYGLVIGPSTGNFYGNDYLRGGLGALTRFGGAILLQNATSEVFGRRFANVLEVDQEVVTFKDTEILVGSALMVGALVYNIATGPASVRQFNRSMGYAMRMEPLRGTGRAAPVLTARIRF